MHLPDTNSIKQKLKRTYDVTKHEAIVGSRMSEELLTEFRNFLKEHRLKMYTELNKAIILYFYYIASRTKHGMKEFFKNAEKWKPVF